MTIVEFTDFQCPACAAMQPILEEVMKTYANRVKLVVRDFRLPCMRMRARPRRRRTPQTHRESFLNTLICSLSVRTHSTFLH